MQERAWQGAPGGPSQPVPGSRVLLAGPDLSSAPSSLAVLQHPGEQHRQSVCPSDHSQVSADSALPLVLCCCAGVSSSFLQSIFHIPAQAGAVVPLGDGVGPLSMKPRGESRGTRVGGWEGEQGAVLCKACALRGWRQADTARRVTLCKYSFPDVMMPSYSRNPWSCVFFIVYLSIELYFIMNLVSDCASGCMLKQPAPTHTALGAMGVEKWGLLSASQGRTLGQEVPDSQSGAVLQGMPCQDFRSSASCWGWRPHQGSAAAADSAGC